MFEPTEGMEYYYNVNDPYEPELVKVISASSHFFLLFHLEDFNGPLTITIIRLFPDTASVLVVQL